MIKKILTLILAILVLTFSTVFATLIVSDIFIMQSMIHNQDKYILLLEGEVNRLQSDEQLPFDFLIPFGEEEIMPHGGMGPPIPETYDNWEHDDPNRKWET